MKKTTLTLFALLGLVLASCGTSSSSVSSQESASSIPASSARESIPASSISSLPPESSKEKESSTSKESSVDPYSVGWDGEIVDMMLLYLNNHVMPYFHLGSELLCTWHQATAAERDPYLLLEGDQITSNIVDDAKAAFEKDGYTVTVEGFSLVCVNQTLGLKAVIEEDDWGYATMKCYWDEPFDASMASDWSKEVKDYFQDFIGGETIPYVYLGTTRVTPEASSDERQITLYGGDWNDSILQYASTAFTAAGWDYATADSDYSQAITATHTSEDYSLTVIVKENYIQKAVMTILYTEVFNIDNDAGSWSTSVESYFYAYMGGHTLPYFYIGTNQPTLYRTTNPDGFEIRGSGMWDDQVISLANAAFSDESWQVTLGQSASFSSQTLTASTTFSDKCKVSVTVEQSRYYGVVVKVTYTEGYNVPTDITDWTSSIKNVFTADFDGHNVPYFYIGARTPDYHYYDTKKLEIYGSGIWDDEILTNAQTALNNDSWDVSSDFTDKTLSASKEYSDGCILELTLQTSDYYGVIVTIQYTEPFDPGTIIAWGTDITDSCNSYLDGHIPPYVYLGTDTPTVAFTEASNTLTLTGGNYDSRVITLAQAAFASGSWTVTENNTDKIVAHTEYSDRHRLTATVTKDSNGKAVMNVRLSAAFDPGTITAWTTELEQIFTDHFDSHALPYIYLGTDAETYYYNELEGTLQISGETWDDSILTLASTALANDQWDVDSSSVSGQLTATKTYDDDHQLSIRIYCDSVGTPILTMKMTEIFNPDSCSEWPDSVKTDMNSHLGNHQLPYIYLGTKNPASKYQSYSPYYLTITGGLWNDQVLTLAETALTADSWNIIKNDSAAFILEAYKTFDGGDTIRIKIGKDYASDPKACITCYYDEAITVPDGLAWSNSISSVISSNLSNYDIPYLYMGDATADSASYLSSWEVVQIKNTTDFNSAYVTNAYNVLTNNDWDCELNLLGTTIGSTLTAVKENTDGSKLILAMYGETDGTHIRIHYSAPYSQTASGAWSSGLQSEMSSDLGGYILPYINMGGNYLGRGEIVYNYTYRTKTLSIFGGVWNDSMFEDCRTVLQNDTSLTWSIQPGLDESDSERGKTLLATATDAAGCTLTFRLYRKTQNYYYAGVDYPAIEITYE